MVRKVLVVVKVMREERLMGIGEKKPNRWKGTLMVWVME